MSNGPTGGCALYSARYCLARAGGGSKIPHRGFSLVELMIGLVLVAILLGIGLPTFRTFILEQRLRATSSDLRVALTLARSEAVKRNAAVELLPNADGWGDGWTIPTPPDANPDNDDLDILNHKQAGDVIITGPDEVTFTPAGRSVAAAEFEIDVGPEASDDVGCLQLQLDGRMTSIRGTCP